MAPNHGFKCRCARCGWTSRRAPKNITRPCPKCGGAVGVHEQDKEAYTTFAVISIIGLVVLAIVFTALDVGP